MTDPVNEPPHYGGSDNPLTIYQKHPAADAYRVGGFYSPYCLVSEDKRFSDAELAAEYWREARDFLTRCNSASERLDRIDRWAVIHRFATLPHFDEEPT